MFRFRLGTSFFRLRRYALIIGVLAIISALCFTYALFYVHTSESSFLRKEIPKGDMSMIETRLEKLEKELQRSRDVVAQFQDKLKRFVNVDSKYAIDRTDVEDHRRFSYIPDHAEFDNSPDLAGFENVRDPAKFNNSPNHPNVIPAKFCPNTDEKYPMAQSTENTLEMYKKIEFDNKDGGVWKQGWNLAYEENQWNEKKKLRIFVVPHSHNDPGWIKTFEKYYADQTQHILSNMVLKMKDDKRRKFIWAEISFFSMWWEKIDKKIQGIVKKLIADGQLEIVTGGWVMNDEATAHYYAMVEQMVEGHQWLQQNLNYRPKNGWAIDPFGLSPTMAYLLRKMGIDNMVIQRVHYSVKKYLARHKSLEFLWRQQWDLNHTMDILCHTMPFYSYDIPHTCGPDPKICCQFDFKRLPGNKVNCPWRIPPVAITEKNVAERAWKLLDQYKKKAQLFQSNVVMIQLGDDFRYDKANEWDQQFNNYQKLFDYINSRDDWHAEAQFGTLDDYFSALKYEMNVDESNMSASFPTLTGDFFTYADRDDHYWSGFFTSRPFYKNMDRALEAYLRGAEMLFSMMMAKFDEKTITSMYPFITTLMSDLVYSRRTLSLFQHHDAITGTSRDHVVIDYASKMSMAFQKLRYIIGQCALVILTSNVYEAIDEEIPLLQTDEYHHHTSLPAKKTITFSKAWPVRNITLYNSLGFSRKQLIKVNVASHSVFVKNHDGYNVPAQIKPLFIKNECQDGQFELLFIAELPPLSLVTYSLHQNQEPVKKKENEVYSSNFKWTQISQGKIIQQDPSAPFVLPSFYFPMIFETVESTEFTVASDSIKATFSGSTGMLKKLQYRKFDTKWVNFDIEIKFMMYGTKTKGKDKSGAYLFLPDEVAKEIDYGTPCIRVLEGILEVEVVVFLKEVEHHFILKKSPGVDGVGFHIYNIINIASEFNKELVMRFITPIANDKREFFTDLNGFQIIKRQHFEKLPLQANVFPVTTMAYMEDSSQRFTLLTGHSVGATCLHKGVFDVFLDRRLNQDDNRGLQQGVTDNKDTPTYFRVLIEPRIDPPWVQKPSSTYPSLLAHHSSLSHLHPVFILIRLHYDTVPEIRNAEIIELKPIYSPMHSEMPCDIHILNLKTLSSSSGSSFVPSKTIVLYLHRLGFDCSYDMMGSCMQKHHNGMVSIDTLFPNLFGKDVEEASLSLLYSGKKFPREAFIQLPTMEIVTLKLRQR